MSSERAASRGRAAASSTAAAIPASMDAPMRAILSGLPADATLGEIENLVRPKCSGRIVSITWSTDGKSATVEFALPKDLEACLGETDLRGATVRCTRPGEPTELPAPVVPLPSTGKRQREAAAAVPIEPVLNAADSAGSSFEQGGSSFDGSALVAAAAASEALACMPTMATSTSAAEGAAEGAAQAPKKPRAQSAAEAKKDKEKRLNRVGLSYRCGRCGMPKKGHVCVGVATDGGGLPASKSPDDSAQTPPGVSPGTMSGMSPTGGWDLDSDSIFKDIKSVLQTPQAAPLAPPPPQPKAANGKASGSKRRSSGAAKMPPPSAVPAVVGEKAAEKTQLLEELDMAMSMQRPPSVITPDDGDTSRATAGAGPSSIVSASDMFSPGQLMTHLLGTPTPAITPGLSPGTLNELGNMLQSPAPPLSATTANPPSLGLGTVAPSPGLISATKAAAENGS